MLVPSQAVERMMRKVGAAMDSQDARERLGVTRTMWDTLSNGYIEGLSETGRGDKMHALYDPRDIDAFIEEATSKATLALKPVELHAYGAKFALID